MTTARLDVASSEDLFYVPFAKKLLWQTKTTLRAQGVKEFTRHFQFSDVAIFIRVWQGGDYIRVRAGKPGEFLVAPHVKKISTATTTNGNPCFLNAKLTKATTATGFATALAIVSRVPQFYHLASGNKHFAGRVDSTPDSRRGYFKGQTFKTSGATALASYAGIFKHSYIDPNTTRGAAEYLHSRTTTAAPTTNAADGIYYHTPALGDNLAHFLGMPVTRRPALHESMFVSRDGKQIVAEEQFMPGNTLGFADYFIQRVIIDVDLGNTDFPVIISDAAHPNGNPASLFELRGSGSVVKTTPTADLTLLSGFLSYPCGSAYDSNGLIHTDVDLDYLSSRSFVTEITGTVTGPGTTKTTKHTNNISEQVTATIHATGLAASPELIVDRVENTLQQGVEVYQGAGPVDSTITMAPFDSSYLEQIIYRTQYVDASIPCVVYSIQGTRTHVTSATTVPTVGLPADIIASGTATDFIRNVAIIGNKVRILSDETKVSAYGPNTHIGAWGGQLLVTSGSAYVNDNLTLPNVAYPNIYWCPNRGLDVARTPTRQVVQFAAQTKKVYIGSADFKHDPNDPTNIKHYVFSHSDDALKKTIVNYILEPTDPIEGAALDDYEIWFSAIRAI